MFYKPADLGEELIDFTSGYTELCVKVWMQSTGTVTLKAENNTNNIVHESSAIAVNTAGAWTDVCFDFAGTAVDGQMIETFVIFFNIGSVPSSVKKHYFDDIVQTGITGVTNIQKSAFRVYPNPVNEVLNYSADFQVDQVIVADMLGKELSRSNANGQGEVSVADLPNGIYIVSFTDEQGRMGSTKFVKL